MISFPSPLSGEVTVLGGEVTVGGAVTVAH